MTICCVFCRGPLVEVWYSQRSCLPSLARMPSGPGFQPALSSTAIALSTLNSKRAVVERNAGGLMIRSAVVLPPLP